MSRARRAVVIGLLSASACSSGAHRQTATVGSSAPPTTARPGCGAAATLAVKAPSDVLAWAHGRPVIGEGALWTIRSAVSVPANPYRTGWILKFPWYTRTNALPRLAGRRLDGAGVFHFDVNRAYDETGAFVTSTLGFSTAGCWEVTGHLGTSTVVFRIHVGYP